MNGEITNSRPRAVAAVATVMLSVVVVAVAGLYLLSGNGSGTASLPSVTPTSATPTSASPSPSEPEVEAPVLPAEAKEPTTKGAAAFARYLFETYNYAFAAIDADPISAISTKACDFCEGVVDDVQSARSQGIRFEGAEIRVTQAVAAPGDVKKGLVVNVLLNQLPGRSFDADGVTRREVNAAENVRADVGVRWTSDGWRVFAVAFPES